MENQKRINCTISKIFLTFAIVLVMIAGIANVYAETRYTYQPVIPEGESANSLFMITPSDITVVEETDTYILNQINTIIDGTKNITFTCTMSAGMNNFSESNFLKYNMPIIKILDSEGNVAAQYSNGLGDLKFKGAAKSDQINSYGGQKTIEFYIGVDVDVLETGNYTLVFGKSLCGNNVSKVLGKDIKFDFFVKATPDIETLIEEIEAYLATVEIGANAGQYPQEAANALYASIEKVEAELQDIDADLKNDKITTEESTAQKNTLAKNLNRDFKTFKATRIVDIQSIQISGVVDNVYVGDEGTAVATVSVAPDESSYKKVKWEASDNILIDEITGEWVAAYAGKGWIRAISTIDSTKSKKISIDVKNEEGTVGVMLSEASVSITDAIKNAYGEDISKINSLKLFTMNSGYVDADSIRAIHTAIPSLKVLDLKKVELDTIGTSWFANWKNLEKVVLPDTLTAINIKAFYNCTNLKEVDIPVNVTNIGSSAFAGCTSMNETMKVMSANPPTVATAVMDSFGDSFTGCDTDQPASISTILVPYGCMADYKASAGWKRYKIVEMEEKPLTVTYDVAGNLAAASSAALHEKGWSESEVTSIKIICENGAYLEKTTDLEYLQTHFLGASIVDLAEAAFPDNNIQSSIFKGRKNVKEIILPEGITHMGREAFYGCSNLRTMTIPSTVRYLSDVNPGIGESALARCDKLKTLIFKSDTPPGYLGALPSNVSEVYVPNLLVDEYKEAYSSWRSIIKEQASVQMASSVTVEAMQTKQLTASVNSVVDLGNSLKWEVTTSQNKNNPIASIDESTGVLVAYRYGTVDVKVTAGSGTMNECSATCSVTITKAPTVTLKTTASGYNSIKLSWTAMQGADGYQVFRSTSSKGTYKVIKTVKTRSLTNIGLSTGTTYYYKVRGYKTVNGRRVYGEYSSVKSAKPVLGKVTKVKVVKGGTKKAKVSWSKVTGASGYVVYRSTKKTSGFKAIKTVKGNKTIKYTTGTMKKGKTYYFKVKAYRTVGSKKVYSPSYSSVVKYKVK